MSARKNGPDEVRSWIIETNFNTTPKISVQCLHTMASQYRGNRSQHTSLSEDLWDLHLSTTSSQKTITGTPNDNITPAESQILQVDGEPLYNETSIEQQLGPCCIPSSKLEQIHVTPEPGPCCSTRRKESVQVLLKPPKPQILSSTHHLKRIDQMYPSHNPRCTHQDDTFTTVEEPCDVCLKKQTSMITPEPRYTVETECYSECIPPSALAVPCSAANQEMFFDNEYVCPPRECRKSADVVDERGPILAEVVSDDEYICPQIKCRPPTGIMNEGASPVPLSTDSSTHSQVDHHHEREVNRFFHEGSPHHRDNDPEHKDHKHHEYEPHRNVVEESSHHHDYAVKAMSGSGSDPGAEQISPQKKLKRHSRSKRQRSNERWVSGMQKTLSSRASTSIVPQGSKILAGRSSETTLPPRRKNTVQVSPQSIGRRPRINYTADPSLPVRNTRGTNLRRRHNAGMKEKSKDDRIKRPPFR